MKLVLEKTIYSPSDLSNFIHCRHLTSLDKEALEKKREKPNYTNKVMLALRERGEKFEAEILRKYQEEGKTVCVIQTGDAHAYEKTLESMKNGDEIIYQARLGKEGDWEGWADFLIRVEKPSGLGSYSYEVMDTKLATETKAATIIQISLYSEAVGAIQGLMPEFMWVKTPQEQIAYRFDDYAAYVRLVKRRFLEALQNKETMTYPEPVAHCDVCVWWEVCNQQRRADDHLGFVAGMGKTQIKEVKIQGVETLEAFANVESPIPFKPNRGAIHTYQKLRDQANIQWRSREEGDRPIHELLDVQPEKGFCKLPEPSKNDVYLDFEGDPLVEQGGLEYLIGWYYQGQYHAKWAKDEAEEKELFETWIDWVMDVKERNPDMHIYHYAPYETTALKRLAGKYASRQEELDQLLRSRTFVDLYGVVRQAVRASVEKYSIKDLEKFFGYVREIDLRKVSKHKSMYEFLLETGKVDEASPEMIEAIRLYNEDDCKATEKLHTWLEELRLESIEQGVDIPRPEPQPMEAGEKTTEFLELIKPIFEQLMEGVPGVPSERTPEQQSRFLLAHMLDWYRREKKSKWWEVLRLKDLTDEELLEEKAAIALISYTGNSFPINRSTVYEYRFPRQDLDYSSASKVLRLGETNPGTIHHLDIEKGILQLKKGPTANHEEHYSRIIFYDDIDQKVKEDAIIRLAEWVNQHGLENTDAIYRAVRSLVLRALPQTTEEVKPQEDSLEMATNWVSKLQDSYLPIQGPPGSGKSYTGSRMILDLIKQGKKVGVTAMSHKVITSLVGKVWELRNKEGLSFIVSQKVSAGEKREWDIFIENKQIDAAIQKADLIAGTPFLFANAVADQELDYLFIDEAGQLSLIDTLACGLSAKNLILLGDPQQLQQPQQGVHPEGTEVSALGHILQDQQTISNQQGIFLDKTYRMHPAICTFDSEQFYENKLHAVPGLEQQVLTGNTRFQGAGLRFVPVVHEGNTNASKEEVDRITRIAQELTSGTVNFTDHTGHEKILGPEDIKIIAPYNAQVNLLKEALPQIEIGTVDKFQGQEAPVMIYSVATSSPEDAPRGMDFLYSPNRFNVAVSRAKAMFILVGAPAIFEPDCKSPAQIKLANPFCRFVEVAEVIKI
jgi:predicted RecB family nuclease